MTPLHGVCCGFESRAVYAMDIQTSNVFNPSYPSYYYYPQTVSRKTTETCEYDEEGRLVKRTVVTEETVPAPETQKTQPYIWVTNNS